MKNTVKQWSNGCQTVSQTIVLNIAEQLQNLKIYDLIILVCFSLRLPGMVLSRDPVSHHRRPRVLKSGIQCLWIIAITEFMDTKPQDPRFPIGAFGTEGEEVQWRQHSAFGSYNRLTTV